MYIHVCFFFMFFVCICMFLGIFVVCFLMGESERAWSWVGGEVLGRVWEGKSVIRIYRMKNSVKIKTL